MSSPRTRSSSASLGPERRLLERSDSADSRSVFAVLGACRWVGRVQLLQPFDELLAFCIAESGVAVDEFVLNRWHRAFLHGFEDFVEGRLRLVPLREIEDVPAAVDVALCQP